MHSLARSYKKTFKILASVSIHQSLGCSKKILKTFFFSSLWIINFVIRNLDAAKVFADAAALRNNSSYFCKLSDIFQFLAILRLRHLSVFRFMVFFFSRGGGEVY